MSESSDKGKSLEQKIAKILRAKLGIKVVRDSRSGAGINKSDINDWYRELPLFIEAKNHKTIKIKEFYKQAQAGASVGQVPTVVFNLDDEEVLACLPFSALVDFMLELQDYRKEVELLREPTQGIDIAASFEAGRTVRVDTCRAGHLSDNYGYCQQLDCKYSRGYRPPKKKR